MENRNNLNPLFKVTNPNQGKTPTQILMERVRAAQEQNMASQMAKAQEVEAKLANAKQKPENTGGRIAAVLADMFNPQGRTLEKFNMLNPNQNEERAALEQQALKYRQNAGSSANALAAGIYQDGAFERQKQLADNNAKLRQDYLDKQQQGSMDLAKYKAGISPNSAKTVGSSKFNDEKMKALGKGAAEFYGKTRDQLISNLPKIQNAISIMDKNKDLTGGFLDKIAGDTGLSIRNEDAYLAQQNMQSAITDTLRPTLGAQFTEKEGERVMNLTFDPKVSTVENRRRAVALQKVIENKVTFQQDLYEYLGKNGGSDEGFDYNAYGMVKTYSKNKNGESEGTAKPVFKSEAAKKLAKKYGK